MKAMQMDRRLIASAAGLALLAGAIGVIVGRSGSGGAPPATPTDAPPTAPGDRISQSADRVAISASQITSAGIELLNVGETSTGAELIAQGTVASTPNGLAVLTAGAAGRVTAIDKRLGDPVRRGERIAALESRDAASITADSATAAAKLRLARATFERERHLYEAKVTARVDFEEARAGLEVAQAEAALIDAQLAHAQAVAALIRARAQ